MKILAIHADYIEYAAKKKAFKQAEEGVEKGKTKRVEECLIVFTAVEKSDEANENKIIQMYLSEVEKLSSQVGTKKIVLYPYAHLSSNLSKPNFAISVMKKAEEKLKAKKDYEVNRAPFGWYKSFNYSCKGHPLSELSRELKVDAGVDVAEKVSAVKGKKTSEVNLKREYRDEKFELSPSKLKAFEKINLSSTMLLALALKELYPEVEFASIGFYQNQAYLDFSGLRLQQNNFKAITKKMRQILKSCVKEKVEIKKSKSVEKNSLSKWQKDIVKDIGSKNAEVFSCKISGSGDLSVSLVALSKGAFVSDLSSIKAFELVGLGSVYWKGNQNNEQLVRVRLVAFDDEKKLDAWKQKRVEAENRSHIKIGKEQGLFVISKLVGAGLPLIAPKGMIIREEIVNFLWELHKEEGYEKVLIPHMAKPDLYKTSGHWDKFGDELFMVKGKHGEFVLKPMNCPHHTQIFDAFSHSYRDLPVRFFEPTVVYRDEKAGQLLGLSRVRAITQDDGHIFCRVSQIEAEVKVMIDIVSKFYKTLGMDKGYWVSLSVRGDDKSKYLGSDKVWNVAEGALEKVAKKYKLPYKKIKGEAAFYGPKLDFMFKDAMGREWQLATIQCDFNLPERFDLSFINEKDEKERPVMIHRAISGSLERFMSVMIEHFAGKFPLWLSPVQVKILTVADRHEKFANEILAKLRKLDIRAEVDARQESIGKKVREAQIAKVNYLLTIGDKEVESSTLAVRERDSDVKTRFGVKIEEFLLEVSKKKESRSL